MNDRQRPSFLILQNILLMVVIYLNAEAGRLLGIKSLPLHFSVVWPATGFSLAALLLFGYAVWPGIFLGNFIYNFAHLFLGSLTFVAPFFTALAITLGSLIQALVGAKVIRTYSTPLFFNSLKDIFIFLVGGGLLTCLIAATIGVLSLYLYGGVPRENVLYTWITFWLGDSMGVYIFCPLIVVWSLQRGAARISQYKAEVFLMFLILLAITTLIFVRNYPLNYLYIPYTLWVTYRFRLHGATLIVFLIALATIIPTSMGYGIFITYSAYDPLLILVTFLVAVLTVTALSVAAVLNEREAALNQLEGREMMLEHEVDMKRGELTLKEKLASLSQVALAIATQLQTPLRKIAHFATASNAGVAQLQKYFQPIKERLDPYLASRLQDALDNLQTYLYQIGKSESQASHIAEVIQQQSSFVAGKTYEMSQVDINAIFNSLLADEKVKKALAVKKEYRQSALHVQGLAPLLSLAFFIYIQKALDGIKEKSALLGPVFAPELTVATADRGDAVVIAIRHNGSGLNAAPFFESFIEHAPLEEEADIPLAYAYDIIVHVHRGQVEVDIKENEYLQLNLTLPKG